ncbi:tyrosine-protein phosphatase [Arthrobacter cheniae]|uniref:Tyrosine-protein phosphatase n=1 Tax=Arthrobacter cheniae TaxID=1258888 RepID=A0A3A5MAC4_9MICC|nr:tyrosine-protein phosphatase [Arthrobacter cheniae]RJT83181.1 tyrosine-protein phosphatase [Arthrobacter cheniae]
MDAGPVPTPRSTAAPVTSSRPPLRAELETPLWDGAVNARDLGGTGGLVQPGRLYRMGRHEWLTEAGWESAWEHGVRTVIDLRNPFERGRRPSDPDVGREVLDRFTLVNLPTEDQSDAEFMALAGPYLNTPEHYRDNLGRWPERFAAIARAFIVAPRGGVVIHCAAGRDRTGMVTALLLDAIGITPEAIAGDYATAVTAINTRYRGQEKPHEAPRSDEELTLWLEHAQGHLAGLLSSLDSAQYLFDAGLTRAELDHLRRRLTDPGWDWQS